MSTLYIVTEIDFEYNDEIYYNNSGDGGTPLKAFRDKKKAENYMKDQAVRFWFDSYNCPSEYTYDNDAYHSGWADKVFPESELACWEVLEEINPEEIERQFAEGDIWRDDFNRITANWPESVKRRFVEHAVAIQVMSIHEVEIDED